jgi:hypothetical protein
MKKEISMNTGFTIVYPGNVKPEEVAIIEQDIAKVSNIKHVTPQRSRGVDISSIATIVQLAPTAVQAAGAVAQCAKSVMDIFNKRGMKGIKIKTAGGVELSIDKGSVDDVEKLVAALKP